MVAILVKVLMLFEKEVFITLVLDTHDRSGRAGEARGSVGLVAL